MFITKSTHTRQGIILLIVLAMLTLFAIIGVSFVMYAGSMATSARNAREAESPLQPNMEPELLLSWFLSQLIFDADDVNGVYSAMRGHSLARTMFGQDSDITQSPTGQTVFQTKPNNTVPYSGIGRIHTDPAVTGQPNERDLVNYQYFTGLPGALPLRDPERYYASGTGRATPNAAYPPNSYVPFNASYTYPDLNNMFLGAVKAGGFTAGSLTVPPGAVLAPSFHRHALFNIDKGTGQEYLYNDPNNPNWRNALGRYMLLRPRPHDQLLAGQTVSDFPYPEDAGGDVKNLHGSPGFFYRDPTDTQFKLANNDSSWMDLGAPVMVAPDGSKYKALFAPFITDLDNRINLNVHGNIRQRNNTRNASNSGWGPWEVNPGHVYLDPLDPSKGTTGVLDQTDTNAVGGFEWTNLFTRVNTNSSNQNPGKPTQIGKYGGDELTPPGFPPNLFGNGFPVTQAYGAQVATPGTAPHFYASVDFDGCVDANYGPTGLVTGPAVPTAPNWFFSAFAVFPTGYTHLDNTMERQNHPKLFNFFNPQKLAVGSVPAYDSVFPISNMEGLLRYGETNSPGLTSELYRLSGKNFDPTTAAKFPNPLGLTAPQIAAMRRQQVTTHSFGYDRAGVTPWAWKPSFSGPDSPNYPNPSQYEMANEMPNPNLFPQGAGPIPFPSLRDRSTGTTPTGSEFQPDWRATSAAIRRVDLNRYLTPYPALPQTPPTVGTQYGPYDPNDPVQQGQVLSAQTARQQFAHDIFMALVEATGAYNPVRTGTQIPPPPPPTKGQLRSLRWLAQLAANIVDYIDSDDIMTPFNWAATANTEVQTAIGDPANEALPAVVFGTELPRVILNEVYSEYKFADPLKTQADVDVWLELHNPFLLGNPAQPGAQDKLGDVFTLDPNRGTAWLHWPGKPQSNYRVMLCQADTYVATATTGGQVDEHMRRPQNVFGSPEAADAGVDLVLKDAGGIPCRVDNFLDPAEPRSASIQPSDGAYTSNRVTPAGPADIKSSNKGFYLLGPPKDFPNRSEAPLDLPVATHKHPKMTFRMPTLDPDGNGPQDPYPENRFMIVLQRLANPYVDQNDATNPWITIDYINTKQTLFDPHNKAVDPQTINQRVSFGRSQPYRASPLAGSSYFQQNPTPATSDKQPKHTFFRHNGEPKTASLPITTLQLPFYWLSHLDRQLVSPMELLHVSAYKPHELLQQFDTPMEGRYAHRAPWFDQTARLYRAFEFLHTHGRAAGVASGGRLPGQINLNTVWDEEILQALCDAQQGNAFTVPDVAATFGRLLQLRSATAQAQSPPLPPYVIGGNDRPFLGMGAGYSMGDGTNGTLGGGIDAQHPTRGIGINDTFLRSGHPTADTHPTLGKEGGWKIGLPENTRRLFHRDFDNPLEDDSPPPLRDQMLIKLFNNATTRSNVFAVWVTVGFFKVTDDSTRPVKLGAEIGKTEGRNIRHRFFAIVDRSNLTTDPVTSTVPGGPPIFLSADYYLADPQSPPSNPPWFHIAGATYVNGSQEPDGLRGLVGYHEGHRWKLAFDPTPGGNNSTWVTSEYGVTAEDPAVPAGLQWKVSGVAELPGPGGVPVVQFSNTTGTPFVPYSSPFLVMPAPGPGKFPPNLGNPGPQPRFNPRDYPWVVRYFSIIE